RSSRSLNAAWRPSKRKLTPRGSARSSSLARRFGAPTCERSGRGAPHKGRTTMKKKRTSNIATIHAFPKRPLALLLAEGKQLEHAYGSRRPGRAAASAPADRGWRVFGYGRQLQEPEAQRDPTHPAGVRRGRPRACEWPPGDRSGNLPPGGGGPRDPDLSNGDDSQADRRGHTV